MYIKKRKRISSKALISLALYKLMLNKEYELITIKDICQSAKVSRMSFYRNYNSKDDIFVCYCDERFAEFYDDIMKSKKILTTQEFVNKLFLYFQKYSRQILTLVKAGKEQILMEQFNSYTKYLFTSSKFNISADRKNNLVFPSLVSGGIFNVLIDWLKTGMKYTPEEMSKFVISVFKK